MWSHQQISDLYWFIASAPVVVLRLASKDEPWGHPSHSLAYKIRLEYPDAAFGVVHNSDIDPNAWWLPQVLSILRTLGIHAKLPPPGYYLLVAGKLCAWQPDLPPGIQDVFRASAESIGIARIRAAKRNPIGAFVRTLSEYDELCGTPAYTFFRWVLHKNNRPQDPHRSDARNHQQAVHKAAIERAYSSLGITETATDAEAKRAYKSLAAKHHPDRPNGNQAKMTELNLAWELIRSERGLG